MQAAQINPYRSLSAFREADAPNPFMLWPGALLPLLDPALGETDRLLEQRKLEAGLLAGTLVLPDVLARIRQKQAGDGRLLLVADQFEERIRPSR